LRAAGRPRLATWSFTLVAVLAGLAVTAFFALPREPVFPLPALAIVGVSLLVLVLQLRGPKKPRQPIVHTPPTPRTGAHDDADAAWFRQLTGLLVGRYDLTPQRAAELARQARDHLAATGGDSPAAEFGPIEEYARDLAEHEPARREPFWRTTPAMLIGCLAGISLATSVFLTWSAEGHYWAAYGIALPAGLGSLWYAGGHLRTLQTTALSRRR